MNQYKRLFWSILLGTASLTLYAISLILPRETQEGITIVLVALSVLFAFFWCWPARERNSPVGTDFFHPSLLFLLFYLAAFVFSGVLISIVNGYRSNWVYLGPDPEFTVNTALILGILSVAAFGAGLRAKVALPAKKLKAFFYRSHILHRTEAKYLIIAFLLIGGTLKLYHVSLLGPLSLDIFRYLSPSARRELDIDLSGLFIIFECMLDWGFLFAIFFFFLRRRGLRSRSEWGIWLILITVFVVVATLDYTLTGKRIAVIPLLLLPLIWRHYLIKRLSLFHVGIFAGSGLALIALLLMIRIIVPLITQDIDAGKAVGESIGEKAMFYFDSAEWATFDMVVAALLQRETLLEEMGGALWAFLKYTFGTLVVFVPRAIWPDKPLYEDPGQVFHHVLTGSNDQSGFAVTVWGTSFLFFHVPGILLGMFIVGWVFRGIYQLLRPWEGRPLDVFFYGLFYWVAFQFLRFGTLGFTFLYFVHSLLIGVLAALFLARNTKFIVQGRIRGHGVTK
jgi:hypothetical protein